MVEIVIWKIYRAELYFAWPWTSLKANKCLFVTLSEKYLGTNEYMFLCFPLIAAPTQTHTPSGTLHQTQAALSHNLTLQQQAAEENIDLEELEQFAKTFKRRRIELGRNYCCKVDQIWGFWLICKENSEANLCKRITLWNSDEFEKVLTGVIEFLSKGQGTYGPTLCLSIDTHITIRVYVSIYR